MMRDKGSHPGRDPLLTLCTHAQSVTSEQTLVMQDSHRTAQLQMVRDSKSEVSSCLEGPK